VTQVTLLYRFAKYFTSLFSYFILSFDMNISFFPCRWEEDKWDLCFCFCCITNVREAYETTTQVYIFNSNLFTN